MSGPLNSIFAAVEPTITANLAPSSIVPTFVHSGAERWGEGAPPRIAWVPTSEQWGPPQGQGGDSSTDSVGNMNLPGGALQPLATRRAEVECDLWGADRDTVETMINAVASAMRDDLYGAYQVTGARWLMQEETSKDGEVYRMTFVFLIPVLRVQPGETTQTVTSIPITPQVQH